MLQCQPEPQQIRRNRQEQQLFPRFHLQLLTHYQETPMDDYLTALDQAEFYFCLHQNLV